MEKNDVAFYCCLIFVFCVKVFMTKNAPVFNGLYTEFAVVNQHIPLPE